LGLERGVAYGGRYASKDGYKAFLERCLMVIPAVEKNAELLGQVKSQLDLFE
jgi:hypothetical protein